MNDLFNFMFETLKNAPCKSEGACYTNPVIAALNASIINELKEISYYIVKLKELNYTNFKISKQAVLALSINLTDTDFKETSFIQFFKTICSLKKEVETFYIEKCKNLNISYENILKPNIGKEENFNSLNNIIKFGETLIKQNLSVLNKNKIHFVDLIIFMAKTAAKYINEISSEDEHCYFEILRFLSLINSASIREEKYIRRIKEFSSFLYRLFEETAIFREKNYGTRQSVYISRDIKNGKAIFISGGDTDELYNLLKYTDGLEINVYTDLSMINSFRYPKINKFKQLSGMFGANDIEFDFSKFKGAIYVTRNCSYTLDNAFRGKIFTTKLIQTEHAIKMDPLNLNPLIETALNEDGFHYEKQKEKIFFDFDKEKILKEIENAKNKDLIIAMGAIPLSLKENYPEHTFIKLNYIYDIEALIFILNNSSDIKSLSIYFPLCTNLAMEIIAALLNKGVKLIIGKCYPANVNPHITEALKQSFQVIETN